MLNIQSSVYSDLGSRDLVLLMTHEKEYSEHSTDNTGIEIIKIPIL